MSEDLARSLHSHLVFADFWFDDILNTVGSNLTTGNNYNIHMEDSCCIAKCLDESTESVGV